MDNLPQFNLIDILALAALVIGLVRGIKRGLSGELAALISMGLAVGGAWYYYAPFAAYLKRNTHLGPQAAPAMAYVLLLVGVWIALAVARFILRHVMEFKFKGPLELWGGALAGTLKAAVLVAALLLVGGLWPNAYLRRQVAERSLCGRLVCLTLGPMYDELATQYPALRLPAAEPRLPAAAATESERSSAPAPDEPGGDRWVPPPITDEPAP